MSAIFGIPWFYRDDYAAFRRLIPERSWHDSYDQWELDATGILQRQRSLGFHVFKAPVRSDAFAEWCWKNGHGLQAQSLSVYASEYAQKLSSAKGTLTGQVTLSHGQPFTPPSPRRGEGGTIEVIGDS